MTKDFHAVSARQGRRSAPPLLLLQLLFAVLAISLGSHAFAQTTPAATNDQPYFYPAPPAGFYPVAASDGDLATYGFPKRPPLGDPSYARWANLMAHVKNRVPNPVAQTTNIIHGPKRRATLPAAPPAGVVGGYDATYSWAGVDVNYSGSPHWAFNGSNAYVTFQAPAIGNENCSYGPYIASIWGGFDGANDALPGYNDVLQAGVNAQACPTAYYAWYEWFTEGCLNMSPVPPACVETKVNLTVHQGDEMYIIIEYTTSSPNGHAFFSDATTGQYVSVAFNQPPCSPGYNCFVGTTAEWIVERPVLGNNNPPTYANLPNFYLPNTNPAYEWVLGDHYNPNGTYFDPGEDPASTLTNDYQICDSSHWNPGSACPGTPPYTTEYITNEIYYTSGSHGIYQDYYDYLYPIGPAASQ